jgi:WD40 repeat protein
VRLWGLTDGIAVRALDGHSAGVWALAFSDDGQWLASADRSGALRILDPATGTVRHALQAAGPVWSLAFAPGDGHLLAATDGGVAFWALASGTRERVLKHPAGRITRMALSPSGDRIATASTDGRVRIFDTERGTLLRELLADGDLVWSVAFSRDGRRLATASGNEAAAVWDLDSGERLAYFSGHTGGATDARILADGVTLVVTDREGRLHWWDLTTRRKLTPPMAGHRGSSWRMALHPNGATLATAGDDGLAKVWDLLNIERACAFGQPGLDAGRRQQYLGSDREIAACDRVVDVAQPHR